MPFKAGIWFDPIEKEPVVIKRQPVLRTNKIPYNLLTQTATDIVIPIYDGLHVVKPCVEAVIKYTKSKYNLIIVNDASPDPAVKEYLSTLNAKIITNEDNRGFAGAVNRGIQSGVAPYVCVLNSDVLVTDYWLTKMVLAMESDSRNMMVNPVTNNTALIDLPMFPGLTYKQMNDMLEKYSPVNYPEIMPTGFCLLIKRSLLNDIGLLDEAYGSYGEETDLWQRMLRSRFADGEHPQYRAVLADDCYLFHERGSTFSQIGRAKHMALRQQSSARFKSIYPDWTEWQKAIDLDAALSPLKSLSYQKPAADFNVAFVVTSTDFCGGMRYIADVVNYLNDNNVNATVVRIKRSTDESGDVLSELRSAPIVFDTWQEFIEQFPTKVFDRGVVVASTLELVKAVNLLSKTYPGYKTVHFAQSYDPLLTDDPLLKDELVTQIGKLDYTYAVSKWVRDKLGIDCKIMTPGIDTNLFHIRNRGLGQKRFTVGVILDPAYPYKGMERGIKLIDDLKAFLSIDVRFLAIGIDRVLDRPYITCLGKLSQGALAAVLGNEIDLFIDPAQHHGYGLPALEALASGCQTVVFEDHGGYIDPLVKTLPLDYTTSDLNKLLEALPKQSYIEKVFCAEMHRDPSIWLKELRMISGNTTLNKKVTLISPHIRKYGGPTTIIETAHELQKRRIKTNMHVVYDDYSPSILRSCQFPVSFDWQHLDNPQIIVVNSDNDKAEHYFEQYDKAKLIMLKLSHNPRFQILENNNLKLPWHHIMTSTDWLRQVCLDGGKGEGWDFLPWPESKVTRVGWYHYSHNQFDKALQRRYMNTKDITIGFLFHQHPLKGTKDSIKIAAAINSEFPDIRFNSIGELEVADTPYYIKHHAYPTRSQLATILSKTDVWLSSSYTEGLGRMTLEAMSAGCAIVASDTNCEFLTHQQNSLVFQPGNIKEAVSYLRYIIGSPEDTMKLRLAGYNTAVQMADSTDYINKVIEVLTNA